MKYRKDFIILIDNSRSYLVEGLMWMNNNSYQPMKKILNVAGSDSTARTIAKYLSGGTFEMRKNRSPQRERRPKRNNIYMFETEVLEEQSQMIMMSTAGYLETHRFEDERFNYWCKEEYDLPSLFNVPVVKVSESGSTCQYITKTLKKEAKKCAALIIWTYDDPISETIGSEVTKVCELANRSIRTYRASLKKKITPESVKKALHEIQLGALDRAMIDAVNIRCEIDFRTGRAFTRFQTQRLHKLGLGIKGRKIWSYGSCQFPTLSFVVDRYHAVQDFDKDESTNPRPELLTWAELISLMRRHGIGQKFTCGQHIYKIKDMGYVYETPEKRFMPTPLGLALVAAYRKVQVDIVDPGHRSKLESDIADLCRSERNSKEVVEYHRGIYRDMMSRVLEPNNLAVFDETLKIWLG